LGLCGKLFTDGLVLFQNLYAKVKLNNYYKAVIVVLISLLISLFFTEISLSGHSIIQQIATRPTTLNILLMLLVGKFIFTLFSYSSGFPGGIFLPMLVIGAILGKLYGNVIINIYDISPDYTIHFMILGMAGYLTAVVRAPITGIILILELTGRFDQLFSLTLVATLAYVLTEFVNLEPIYDVLYQRFLSTVNKSTAPQCKNSAKITLLLPVVADSPFDSKFVYQIKWPSSCLLVGIRRDQHEIIPKGNTQILSGDLLIVLTDKNNAGAIQQELYRLGTDTK
ncbi:MAG: chloride channel protein, partial [Lentisphaeria bacterium]|nr:chloride channel protein [Lentisphaeria bacterium]